jgi:hypothetical protein
MCHYADQGLLYSDHFSHITVACWHAVRTVLLTVKPFQARISRPDSMLCTHSNGSVCAAWAKSKPNKNLQGLHIHLVFMRVWYIIKIPHYEHAYMLAHVARACA